MTTELGMMILPTSLKYRKSKNAMAPLPASTTKISLVKSRRPVCLTIMEYVFPRKENNALIMRTEKTIDVKFSVKFEGTEKLNLKRNANSSDDTQINRSMLKIIHDGVVERKNLIDFVKIEFWS